MAGYVLGDKDLVDKALYSSKKDKSGGYFRQLDLLFSPDGYYAEGLYYVRYALMPFFYFAQVIENNQPELQIFEYRNKILKNAFYSAMQLTNTNGAFLPINDALKEKDFRSPEVVVALNMTYKLFGRDASLLSIAREQNSVMLSAAGVEVAKGLATLNKIPEFKRTSIEYTDGGNGNEGGIGVLRFGPLDDQEFLVMKYTAHGLSHGHFDKLNLIFYDQGNEILQDYGAARFINVEPKFGGRYLPETKSFTMQTIAHNTVTIDEQSHYQGKMSIAEQYHPVRHFYSIADSNCQVMSAKASNVYKGVEMHRTMAMVKDERLNKPFIIDIFKIDTKDKHQYDLPFYYLGHLIHTNVKYKAHDKERTIMGKANGYQHLWKEAEGKADSGVKFSWLQGNRYYSVVTSADTSTQVFFTRIGAGDPNFNLRSEPGVIIRQNAASHVFASIVEPHGSWDGVKEFSKDAYGRIQNVKVLAADDETTVVNIIGNDNLNWLFFVANKDASEKSKHKININKKLYEWVGPFKLVKQK
jgi:hypothetical protein